MRRKTWTKAGAVLLAAAMLLGGCQGGGESKPAASGTSAQTGTTAAQGTDQNKETSAAETAKETEAKEEMVEKDIVMGEAVDIKTRDPQEAFDIYSFFMLEHVYNGLVKLDMDGSIVCDLAESYDILDDTTYHFVLKKGVHFHDGSELKASDVKFTLERGKEKPQTVSETKYIESVTTEGDYELTIKLSEPFPSILYSLSGPKLSILSEAAVKEAEKNGGTYGENVIGTGPYKFVEWEPNDHWKIERFDDYFAGAPLAPSLTVRIIPENSARIIALETGELDIAMNVDSVGAVNIEANSDLVLESGISPVVMYLGFNTQKGALQDEKVRQAIAYALDKQQFVDTIIEGRGEIANSFIGKTVPGWNEKLEPYPYDPQKARELLTEAGYGEGLPLTLFLSGDTNNRSAQLIQAQLMDVGIDVDINLYERGSIAQACREGRQDMFIMGWSNQTGDPDFSFYPLFHSESIGSNNYSFMNDKKLDDMIKEARVDMDSDRRIQEYKEIQEYLKELSPWVPLYYGTTMVGRRADLQGLEFNSAIGTYIGNCHY